MGVLKKTWDDTWLSFLTPERSNSKHQSFSTTCKHHNKIINQRNGRFVAYTPCLKCHAHNNLTGLRRVYVGLGSLVYIINLRIAPVDNVLMRLGCQGKETEDFSGQWLFFFQTWKLSSWKQFLCLVTHPLFWLTCFKKDTIFYNIDLMHGLCTKLWFDFNFIANTNPYTT